MVEISVRYTLGISQLQDHIHAWQCLRWCCENKEFKKDVQSEENSGNLQERLKDRISLPLNWKIMKTIQVTHVRVLHMCISCHCAASDYNIGQS